MKEIKFIFCKCGHVHMISVNTLYKCHDNKKSVILSCTTCGAVTKIGYTEESNFFCPYISGPVTDLIVDSREFQNHETIIFSSGIPMILKTGNVATAFKDGRFYDNKTLRDLHVANYDGNLFDVDREKMREYIYANVDGPELLLISEEKIAEDFFDELDYQTR